MFQICLSRFQDTGIGMLLAGSSGVLEGSMSDEEL